MPSKLLLAIGIPTAYLVVSTVLLLRGAVPLPDVLQRLSTRKALAWNTMVGLSIALATLRWALHR